MTAPAPAEPVAITQLVALMAPLVAEDLRARIPPGDWRRADPSFDVVVGACAGMAAQAHVLGAAIFARGSGEADARLLAGATRRLRQGLKLLGVEHADTEAGRILERADQLGEAMLAAQPAAGRA